MFHYLLDIDLIVHLVILNQHIVVKKDFVMDHLHQLEAKIYAQKKFLFLFLEFIFLHYDIVHSLLHYLLMVH
jgi:hypothetical protein